MTPSLRRGQAVLAHLGSNGSSYQSSNQLHRSRNPGCIVLYQVQCAAYYTGRDRPRKLTDYVRGVYSVYRDSFLKFSSHSRGTYTCLSYARTSRMRQPTLYFTFTYDPPTGIQSAQEFRNKGARARAQMTNCPSDSITWDFIYDQYRSLYITCKITEPTTTARKTSRVIARIKSRYKPLHSF
jgi:hypothetical protein